MNRILNRGWLLGGTLAGFLAIASVASAHPHSLHAFLKARQADQQQAAKQQAQPAPVAARCRLKIQLRDAANGRALPGLVRITQQADGKVVPLNDLIERPNNWNAMDADEAVAVPRAKLRVEAIWGLETESATATVDTTGKATADVTLQLKRFYDTSKHLLRSGNTHLHLHSMTRPEADRYLQVVPRADDLDLVYVSHLRRVPDERTYITNSYTHGDLARLSRRGITFALGEEHRHNFAGYGEGYGHVMFLDIKELIRPVSIGPGIMKTGTDGRPMNKGILQARGDGATVVWCHNRFGMEDVPNWMAGVLDAQNIFDGGNHGSYEDSFYRYLNLGLKIPFSTGTDWFIYDFARVYVPIRGPLSSNKWLSQLKAGRSYITNGPLLELEADGKKLGDTLSLDKPGKVKVTARATGRLDFQKIELIYNGQVLNSTTTSPVGGHFEATMQYELPVEESGWLALRVAKSELAKDAAKSELGKDLFAHTSPIYVDIAGRKLFRAETARELIAEMEASMAAIIEKGTFANDAERESVLEVYRRGIAILQDRLKHNSE